MEFELQWSDLIIEQGKLDPLGIWRVGDRLINELLPPFTTVVTQRPARYFSMYCWIVHHITAQQPKTDHEFWRHFFELEILFISAIQLHTPHAYQHFGGMIGSEYASKLINQRKQHGSIDRDLLKNERIPNGWETNYKSALEEFYLTEVDHGVPGNLKLTAEGEKLAHHYFQSIKASQFFQNNYLSAREIPLNVLEDLATYACPCLLYAPPNDTVLTEQKVTTQVLLDPTSIDFADDDNALWASIWLVLDYMYKLTESGQHFNMHNWRRMLTTQLYPNYDRYMPRTKLIDTFQKWRMYALDSLLVFALESGLEGFLEFLHSQGGHVKSTDVTDAFNPSILDEAKQRLQIPSFMKEGNLFAQFAALESESCAKFEAAIVDLIRYEAKDRLRVATAYLLYVYTLALYERLKGDDTYADALEFYDNRADYDGHELSLVQAYEQSKKSNDEVSLMRDIFLGENIIHRQLTIRRTRAKQMAWFDKSSETGTYDWENDYRPTLYRASRMPNLLYFLLNLDIAEMNGETQWNINNSKFPKEYLDWI